MTDTTLTKMVSYPESESLEQACQQIQEDQACPSSAQAWQSHTGSSGQRTAPGRKPLFRS